MLSYGVSKILTAVLSFVHYQLNVVSYPGKFNLK